MAFTYADWQRRISKRNDITGMLTHLTRPNSHNLSSMTEDQLNIASVDNLIKILEDKKIIGSSTASGFIIGNKRAVCFQDAPLQGIIQNVENEIENRLNKKTNKVRYCGNGLIFSKYYVFGKGGRPVIYDITDEAKAYLPIEQHWRIVNLQLTTSPPKTIDWTHEREWRLSEDFDFGYELTHIVLYNKMSYDHFKENCPKHILDEIHGITILKSIIM